MPNIQLRVTARETGLGLLDFLARRRNMSRRQAKDLLDRRTVFVNQRRVWMARHPLRAGDEVDIPATAAAAAAGRTPILHADADYLVVDKPAGIPANGPHSLESRLRAELDLPELAAAHRLDRGTSGCLIFARHPAAREKIIPLFAGRAILKIYHALAGGWVQPERFTINAPLAGRPAITAVRVLAANRQASHLQIVIPTGRTHQIRRHLLARGHPLLGEPYYAPRRAVGPLERLLPRPMLHASRIVFRQPCSGARIDCQAPLPADFRQALVACGLD